MLFGSEKVLSDSEEEEYNEQHEIEKENQVIMNFVKTHPMPSPDDDDGDDFWHLVIDRFKKESELDTMLIFAYVRFDIIEKMYNNLIDKDIIIQCGKDLNKDGKMNAMLINHYLLAGAIRRLNNGKDLPYSPTRVIELWWDGIGEWRG